jgi:predicted lipoprotein with Yx(FWY)xxD motif
MRKRLFVTAVSTVAVAFGVGGTVAGAASAAGKTVTVSTKKVSGLGKILVGPTGKTLYIFVPDKQKKVTCKGSCLVQWPPLKVPAGAKVAGKRGVSKKLLGTDRLSGKTKIATYNKWPLYYWVADTKPGQATGQALNNSGGLWYVISSTGKVIKAKK